VGILKQPLYNYRYRATSITQTASKKKIIDLHDSLLRVKAFLQEQGVFETYQNDYTLRHLQQAVCGGFVDYLKMPESTRDAELDAHMNGLRFGGYLSDANLSLIKQAIAALPDDEQDTRNTYLWLHNTIYALKNHYGRFVFTFKVKYYLILLWLQLPGVLRRIKRVWS
jgi:hypothetical protein